MARVIVFSVSGWPRRASFGLRRPDRGQADTAQRDRRIPANIAIQRKLYRGARRRINRRGALKCQVRPTASLGRNFYRYLAD